MQNLEIFQGEIEKCESCGMEVQNRAVAFEHKPGCTETETETLKGFFYWFCMPGCLPDSDMIGPFKTEQDAARDAQENFGDDSETVDADSIDANVRQYLVTALWSETDDDGNPLDSNYDVSDFHPDALAQAVEDWNSFQAKAGNLLDGLELTTVAHDLWLTRNRHGAGFWDGDYPETIGRELTRLAQELGETDAYIGDDGKIHLS